MRTIQKTVYTFDELSDEAKEKAINSFRNDPINFESEAECTIDNWKEKLQEIGFEDAEIQYSGFYHQGEGASFVSDIDINKVLNTLIMCDIINRERALLYNKVLYMDELKIVELVYMVYRTDRMHCHENTVSVDSDSEFYLNECPEAEDYFNQVFEELRDDIQDYVRELCQEIFFDLRRNYEYTQSEEYITDFIINNEYEFYEDGTIY